MRDVINDGNAARELLEDERFEFFREFIRTQQEEILKRVASNFCRDTNKTTIEYDEFGKITGKKTIKLDKNDIYTEYRNSYTTFADIVDFLLELAEKGGLEAKKRKSKEPERDIAYEE
jgi:hypothetical protein